MLKDNTFGQYFPGDTLLHNTDARIKIILLIVFIVMNLSAKNLVSMLAVVFFTLVLILISKLNPRIILRSMKPVLIILCLTTIINLFFYNGETIVVEWRFITIYREGITNAVMLILRLLSLLAGTTVILSYTTSPFALTGAIESLLSPLKRIKVPVHDFAMMMSIALRFVPVLIEETQKIMNAQKARGADFESGGLIKRAKSLVPILIPLFISAIRRAEELAEAMECRCYRGGAGQTKMNIPRTRLSDYIFLLVSVGCCVLIFFINRYAPI